MRKPDETSRKHRRVAPLAILAALGAAAVALAAVDPAKLPLGDAKYGSTPRAGWVYSCQTSRTSTVTWDGMQVQAYHYDATLDFPYTVGCYRGTPITAATGLQLGGGGAGPPPGAP